MEKSPLLYALLGLAVAVSAGGLVAGAAYPLTAAALWTAGGLGAGICGMGLASVVSQHFAARGTSELDDSPSITVAVPAVQLDQSDGPAEQRLFADRIRTASREPHHGQSR